MKSSLYQHIINHCDKKLLNVNTPLFLDDSQKVWMIGKGRIIVNSIYFNQKEPNEGKKFFFYEAPEGMLVFGLDRTSTCKAGLFLEAYEASEVYEFSLSTLRNLIPVDRSEIFSEISSAIKAWIIVLFEGLMEFNTHINPTLQHLIENKCQYQINAGDNFSSRDFTWCEALQPSRLSFCGFSEVEIPHGGYAFPVYKRIYFQSHQDFEARGVRTSTLIESGEIWQHIQRFYTLIMDSEALEIEENIKAEEERLKRKYLEDEISFHQSLIAVKETLEGDPSLSKYYKPSKISNRDPLYNACSIAANYAGIELTIPNNYEDSDDPLGDICRYSRVRYREILLEDNWYLYQGGSFVSFDEETKDPIALIPTPGKGYRVINPQTKETYVITQKNAYKIAKIAYSFYESLPARPLTIRDILNFIITKETHDLFVLISMGFFTTLLAMGVPVLTGVLFDDVIPNAERDQLWFIGLALITASIGGLLFELTKTFAILRLESQSDHRLQSAVWDRLLDLPTTFFRDYSSGDLASRSMGISQIRNILSGIGLNTVLSGVFSLMNFALLFYYSVNLALLGLGLVLIFSTVLYFLGLKQVKLEKISLKHRGKMSSVILQLLGGISKFRVTGTELKAFSHWLGHFNETNKAAMDTGRVKNIQQVVDSTFSTLSRITIYVVLVILSQEEGGGLSTGQFLAFNAAYGSFVSAMRSMSSNLLDILEILPLYERTKPILDTVPENDGSKIPPEKLRGNIEINHLKFRYEEDSPYILDDISIDIKEGEFLAIVGPSGSGKSTIVRLLLGFEKPTSGNILFDKQDLKSVDTRLLRRQIGVVLQDGKLMPGDIFTNIIGASTTLTLADAWEAAKAAAMEKDIESMPMGMHTVISEGAGTFSGGQRQRMMIARAIVHKPKILIFDEATSALDNQTQQTITDSLNNLQATKIVIAHRLSTIQAADKIMYLENGKVMEIGTYEELMERKSYFYRLAERQIV